MLNESMDEYYRIHKPVISKKGLSHTGTLEAHHSG